ncbi:MAG: hypothetical protein LUH01_15950, partial [Parabacteroides gordonii]|nr:hypothetical protein [Parabacteroides gordonii]
IKIRDYLCITMNKKVVNKATTREQRLYQKDKDRVTEYYSNIFKEDMKAPDIQLNLHGYTNLKK